MDKLKCALLEIKNTFNNIPIVSKIFMLIYLIIVFFNIFWKYIKRCIGSHYIFIRCVYIYIYIVINRYGVIIMICKKQFINYFKDENNKRYKVETTKFIFEPEFLFKTRHFLKFILKMKIRSLINKLNY